MACNDVLCECVYACLHACVACQYVLACVRVRVYNLIVHLVTWSQIISFGKISNVHYLTRCMHVLPCVRKHLVINSG